MENANIGNVLNSISMQTEDKDEEDVFLDSLNQAMVIASSVVRSKNRKEQKYTVDLVPASNKITLINLNTILK
jgi:hypothetical protein